MEPNATLSALLAAAAVPMAIELVLLATAPLPSATALAALAVAALPAFKLPPMAIASVLPTPETSALRPMATE